ncbi:cyclic pyranopterin monophosphate synthase MoaC [Chitinophaga lutea]
MSNTSTPALTHVSEEGLPSMVDVGDKALTRRTAVAESRVWLPPEVLAAVRDGELTTAKGAVFQTAVIAGIMGAKRTPELIPLCHHLLLDGCDVRIRLVENEAVIRCFVRTTGKTGVEMEALAGASIAALTIYDMCKALSQEMVIRQTRLLEKKGGKHDIG